MRVKLFVYLITITSILSTFHTVAFADIRFQATHVKQDASLDPFDPVWDRIPTSPIRLLPQTLFTPRGGGATKEVLVQAFYTKRFLYLRLVWTDATKAGAQEVHRTEGFDDAVAVQFPFKVQEGYPSPFMGDSEHLVNIWQWKASWQESLDMAQAHPRTVRDDEPFPQEATFRTGEAAGNLFSQRERSSPIEHLIASGFGTLTTTKNQPVEGRGVWRDGNWHVVLRRALTPQEDTVEVDLRDSHSILIAFAVWEGAHLERDGMKSISIWQTLLFERPVAWWERAGQRFMKLFRKPPSQTPEKIRLAMIEKGKSEVVNHGCIVCHGAGGRGGIRNPNAATFQEVPPLVYVAEGFTKEELMEKIRQGSTPAKLDPDGVTPERLMPAWHPVMSDEELEAVTAYLMSLLPEETEVW